MTIADKTYLVITKSRVSGQAFLHYVAQYTDKLLMIAPLHIVVLLKMVSAYNIGSLGVFNEQIDTFK